MQLQNYQSKYLFMFQYVVYGSVILYFGKDLFVPLSFAALISFVLYPVCVWLEKKGVSRLMGVVLSMVLLIVLGALLITLLITQFLSFLKEWPTLQIKLAQSWNHFSSFLTEHLDITKAEQDDYLSRITDQSSGSVMQFIRKAVSASTFSAVLLVLIPVYAILILLYRKYWMKVLANLFPAESDESLREMISLTIKTFHNFIKGMVIVYLIVGILNSVGLLVLGVPHAILFGFIAAVLTFIPYVGIMIGSLLPITMAWITYDSVWYPVGIIAIFTFVQYLEANVIFPIAVSSRLNVNTLVTLLAIFAGGILWGMAGMILFVPFIGIIKLIADHNPKWKSLAMLLGTDDQK